MENFAWKALLLCCLALCVSQGLAQNSFVDNGGDVICQNIISPVTTVFPNAVIDPNNTLPATVSPFGGNCRHFYRGWDVTGVVNEFDLTAVDGIQHSCDCIKECMKRIGVCMAWVWKFTGASDQRTCTLYSQFNLPPSVTLSYGNTTASQNAGVTVTPGLVDANPHNTAQFGHIQPGNLVQPGSKIPQCVLNDGTTPDPDCKSGMIVLFGNNNLVC